MKENRISLKEVFGPTAFSRVDDNYAIFYVLGDVVLGLPLKGIEALVDRSHAGAELQGEPGWRIERQMEVGEGRRKSERLLERFPHGGHVIKDPGPEAGPNASWPEGARYKVELYEPEEFGNPAHPLRYYDAATFESFLQKILTVYIKYHPEAQLEAMRILKLAHYWVELDSGVG
jgi:hypothetical protein